jgi:Family of unknown function (DUF6812)
VGVPPPRPIPFGHDQHVLAERRQVLPAERADIRRGLAILRRAHFPPDSGLKLGHSAKDSTDAVERLSSRPVEHRATRIIVETDRYRITGVLQMPRDGYRSRLTDYLNSSERAFLPLTDVEVAGLDGNGHPEHHEFLALSLSHIVLAMPADASSEIG